MFALPLFNQLTPDPRAKDLPFVDNPLFVTCMVIGYIIFAIYLGPKFMYNRKPFNLKKFIIVYNFFHAAFSAYIFFYGGFLVWFFKYSWICEPTNYGTDSTEMEAIYQSWLFYLSRYVEFVDTILFILTKKFDHVSTLHVVHHSLVPIITWIGLRYIPGGHYTFSGWVNTFVHMVMYSYYMLAALGPKIRKYLWWKKYLTILQLAQFIIVFGHTVNTLITDCAVPKWFGYIILFECVLFFYLFLKFYNNAYVEDNTKKNKEKQFFFIKVDNFFTKNLNILKLCTACIPDQTALYDDPEVDKKIK